MKKLALLTTFLRSPESKRIEDEAKSLGYDFKKINLNELDIVFADNKLKVDAFDWIDKDTVVILRGILKSIKPVITLVEGLRARGIKVFDNSFLDHQYSIDKVTDLIKLTNNKVRIPKTIYPTGFPAFPNAAKFLGFPVVVKITKSGKGANVYKANSEGELSQLIKKLGSLNMDARNFILQEYIPYKFDLRCLVIGEFVFTMRRIPTKGEFRANFSLGGSVELFELDNIGRELALKALKAVNMTVGGVDILISESNERYILEVNHTPGFMGMEKATGQNIGKLFVRHAVESAK